jgi:hypothetical protein
MTKSAKPIYSYDPPTPVELTEYTKALVEDYQLLNDTMDEYTINVYAQSGCPGYPGPFGYEC